MADRTPAGTPNITCVNLFVGFNGKGGKTRGGKIIRFPRSDDSDLFREWSRLQILIVFPTLS